MIEKFGIGCAWADEQEVDVLAGKLGADGFGPAAKGELASAVFAVVGNAAMAKDRADVDDHGLNSRLQIRDGKAGEFGSGEKVDFHYAA